MIHGFEVGGGRRLVAGLALAALVLSADDVGAQGLSSQSSSATGSTCSGANDSSGFCGWTEPTTTATASTFTSRYAWNINADAGTGGGRVTSGTARHNMAFQATAPGSYTLEVSVSRRGALGRHEDQTGCLGSADVTGVTGSSNRGLTSGSLSLADPGVLPSGSGSDSLPFSQSASAVIGPLLSNGVAQNHNLTFTWSGSVTSAACEVSVRLGLRNFTTTSCTACDYSGSPSRTEADDGFVVTVSFTNFCGDGVVNGTGEQCDQAGANGTASSCCTSNCTFRSSSETCRASAGPCDLAETCSGAGGTCPADGFQSASTECRAAAGPCDLAENCTGSGADCPGDAKSTAVCREAAGVCDMPEQCDGVANECPLDVVLPAGTACRASAGVCDPVETCDGSGTACPVDAKSSAVCREAAGVCDTPEQCDGVADDCPVDAVEPEGTTCRPSAGACDLVETCDGSDTACPDDAKSSGLCRPDAGVCDVAENCDGVSDVCPSDAFEPDGTSCADTQYCNGEEACHDGDCYAIGGPCDFGQGCDEGLQLCFVGNCPVGPALTCSAAGRSALLVRGKADDAKDRIVWKFLEGQMFARGDFADPTADSDYTLCFYAGAAEELVAEANLPASDTLFGALGDKGWAYKDPARTQAGIGRLLVKGGGEGQTKAMAQGRGVDLPDFPLPFGAAPGEPVIVQLRNSATGMCLSTVFDSPTTDSAEQFKAREP